jgi:glucose-6-phosphate 1-epimerase
VEGPGGLMCLDLSTAHSTARIFLQGAHVASFQRNGEQPLLFLSSESVFAPGKAIRGGVPVIFPWFGARAGDSASPAHGFARTCEWNVASISQDQSGAVSVVFTLSDSPETRALWPFEFQLRYEIVVGTELGMSLRVENRSAESFQYEEALHTYFLVSDVRNVRIEGLLGAEYIDKVDGFRRKTQDAPLIEITAETDRVYAGTRTTCTAADPGMLRVIRVVKEGSDTTVVWNPWIAKSAAMSDFGDDEWPTMLCIETANAGENAVTLDPGAAHVMRATVSSEHL